MSTNLKLGVIIGMLCILEGVHIALVDGIKSGVPELYARLGNTGPGYYFLGRFRVHPTYKKLLTKGDIASSLHGFPVLKLMSIAELALWYGIWCVAVLCILI